jgi:hypothetical protein
MLLGRDPDDPGGERGSRRVLGATSSNPAALAPSLLYEIGDDDEGHRLAEAVAFLEAELGGWSTAGERRQQARRADRDLQADARAGQREARCRRVRRRLNIRRRRCSRWAWVMRDPSRLRWQLTFRSYSRSSIGQPECLAISGIELS